MQRKNVTYADWPDWVKVLTAFYFKPAMKMIKNPVSVRNLSFLSFAVGIIVLAEFMFIQGLTVTNGPIVRRMNFGLFFIGVLNILLGALNLFYNYKVHLWVNENSSWEERFAYKSSGKHQFQYLLIWVAILGLSLAVACLVCC